MPAADDNLFLATRQPEVTVLILTCQIAGIKPGVAIGIGNPYDLFVYWLQLPHKHIGATY